MDGGLRDTRPVTNNDLDSSTIVPVDSGRAVDQGLDLALEASSRFGTMVKPHFGAGGRQPNQPSKASTKESIEAVEKIDPRLDFPRAPVSHIRCQSPAGHPGRFHLDPTSTPQPCSLSAAEAEKEKEQTSVDVAMFRGWIMHC
ncbi:hypothetical protein MMC20_005254 [Loxospora ochrophaea]|nr:hypothetical protein [Loxospora ochrophaea]